MTLNLHSTVRATINAVNGDMPATLRCGTGYTTAATGKQTPTYSDTPTKVQVQALGPSELKRMLDLNIQGIMRKVYLFGDYGGPVRADATGGDLLLFARVRGGPQMLWKIVTEFEAWTVAGWCCVGVVMVGPAS